MGKKDNNTRIIFKDVKLPFNKSLNEGQSLGSEVEEEMIKQKKKKDEFMKQRRGSLGV